MAVAAGSSVGRVATVVLTVVLTGGGSGGSARRLPLAHAPVATINSMIGRIARAVGRAIVSTEVRCLDVSEWVDRSRWSPSKLLSRSGRPGRAAAIQIDTALHAGPRTALRQAREEQRAARRADPTAAFYRRVWREAATARGAALEDLPGEFLRLSVGGRQTVVWRQMTQLDDAVVLKLAADKPASHQLLAAAGLDVPGHAEVAHDDMARAEGFLAAAPSGRIVVKPASGTDRGLGVTGGIRHTSELRRALLRAARWDDRLLLEHHVDGAVYRALVLEGSVVDVVRRSPPSVVGDGSLSIDHLIGAENDQRLDAGGEQGLALLKVDLDCLLHLAATGRRPSTVLGPGEAVVLKSVINQNRPQDNETVRPVPTRLAAAAAAAATAIGLRLAGVDLIWDGTGAPVVLEVNGTPGFNLHYHVRDRATATPVTEVVLDALLRER